MTFDDVGAEPDQEFEVSPDRSGIIEYATKQVLTITFRLFVIYLHYFS